MKLMSVSLFTVNSNICLQTTSEPMQQNGSGFSNRVLKWPLSFLRHCQVDRYVTVRQVYEIYLAAKPAEN